MARAKELAELGSVLTVDSGNVGIGITSPAQSWTGGASRVFQLNGLSTSTTVVRINEAGGTFGDLQLVSASSGNAAIYNFANGPLRFGTNSAEQMRIDASGNVGIGATNPQSRLNLWSSSSRGEVISNTYPTLMLDNTNAPSQFFIAQPNADVYFANLAAGSLIYQTNATERMRITSSGNVGIGTSSPANKLHVYGGSSGASTYDARYKFISESNGENYLGVYGTTYVGLRFLSADTQKGYIDYYIGTNEMIINSISGSIALSAGGAERIRIPSDAGGIKFPATQSASSDANTLDDYEEGTWTPTLKTDGTQPTVSYAGQLGRYTKIGNRVYVEAYLAWSSVSGGSGSIVIGGLPFTPSGYGTSDSRGFSYLSAYGGLSYTGQLMSIITDGTPTALVYYNNNGSVSSQTLGASPNGTLRMIFNYATT